MPFPTNHIFEAKPQTTWFQGAEEVARACSMALKACERTLLDCLAPGPSTDASVSFTCEPVADPPQATTALDALKLTHALPQGAEEVARACAMALKACERGRAAVHLEP